MKSSFVCREVRGEQTHQAAEEHVEAPEPGRRAEERQGESRVDRTTHWEAAVVNISTCNL